MTSALILFRQAYARDLAPSVTRSIKSIRVEGIVGTTAEAITVLESGPIDLVIMGPTFIEATHDLAAACQGRARPVFVVLHRGEGASARARAEREGIEHVISMSNGLSEVFHLIGRAIGTNQPSTCRDVADQPELCSHRVMIQVNDDIDCEIVRLVAAGFTDRDIADVVHMSHQTIRNRVSRILGETGARNRTHLACLYLERAHGGLVPFETLDGPYRPVATVV